MLHGFGIVADAFKHVGCTEVRWFVPVVDVFRVDYECKYAFTAGFVAAYLYFFCGIAKVIDKGFYASVALEIARAAAYDDIGAVAVGRQACNCVFEIEPLPVEQVVEDMYHRATGKSQIVGYYIGCRPIYALYVVDVACCLDHGCCPVEQQARWLYQFYRFYACFGAFPGNKVIEANRCQSLSAIPVDDVDASGEMLGVYEIVCRLHAMLYGVGVVNYEFVHQLLFGVGGRVCIIGIAIGR